MMLRTTFAVEFSFSHLLCKNFNSSFILLASFKAQELWNRWVINIGLLVDWCVHCSGLLVFNLLPPDASAYVLGTWLSVCLSQIVQCVCHVDVLCPND